MSNHHRSQRVRDLLADVLPAGGCMTVGQWRALTLRHGYKYANGFFGGRSPYMVADGHHRCLTARGRAAAQ